jgi:hypothetical protein
LRPRKILRGATRSSLTVSGAAGGGRTSTNTRAASQAKRSGSSGNPRAGFRIHLQAAAAAAAAAHQVSKPSTNSTRSAASLGGAGLDVPRADTLGSADR